MRVSIPEDFICLVILNKDDSNFKLFELANRKNAFLKQVVKQFLRQNSSTVASELSIVSKQKFSRIKINKNDI
jgi:16S rRNA G527 N7-methylase RsmG